MDGTALYRLPQYAHQMHPVTNPELGIPGPSAFYNPYLIPAPGTRMFSHPANHMDQLPSSSHGVNNFPPNVFRGSSKRNEQFPATPSTVAMPPMNVGHFDAGVTILDACFPSPEFRGNYIGQPCRPPTSTWCERPPISPYFEASNIAGVGSQNLPHYNPMLHPPQMIPHYRPQAATNSSRHPFNNRMQYSRSSYPQQGHDAVPLPPGIRIYRSHRRSAMPEGINRHPNLPHLRLLEEGVAILEFSGHYEMSNAVDHHRDMRLDIDYMSYEELLALSERIGNVKTGLSEDDITAHLKTRVYRSSMASIDLEELPCSEEINDSCVICQDEYEDNDIIGSLNCGHEYHVKCLKKWLPVKNTCPICKSTALNDEEQKKKKKKSGQIQ